MAPNFHTLPYPSFIQCEFAAYLINRWNLFMHSLNIGCIVTGVKPGEHSQSDAMPALNLGPRGLVSSCSLLSLPENKYKLAYQMMRDTWISQLHHSSQQPSRHQT